MFTGRAVSPDMFKITRAFKIFAVNFAFPEKLNATLAITAFLLENMIGRNLKIETAMERMTTQENVGLF
jgi:hypothetical protein